MALGYVRPARLDDVDDITRVQLTTWRVAYRRLVPRHVLDRLDEDWMASRWRDAIANPPSPEHRVVVAVEQAETVSPAAEPGQAYLVGFAASGPADDDALAPNEDPTALGTGVAAVTDLLVEPRWGRRGHGSRLLASCVDSWRSDGFATAVAWTFDADTATRSFLIGAGWAPDGASRALDIDDLLIPQVRMHVGLATEPETPDAPTVTAV